MTIADRVLDELRRSPGGLTDRELAIRLGVLHQQVNARCRTLAVQGMLVRDNSARPLINRLAGSGSVLVPPPSRPSLAGFAERDVQAAVVRFLAAEGWRIVRVADTDARERGTDVVAEANGRTLHVEAKGWPGTTYARGERAGQPKPTAPSVQAAHWYAGVLLSALRLRERRPDDDVAIALPDRLRYRNLLGETRSSLAAMRVGVLLVADDGRVESWE